MKYDKTLYPFESKWITINNEKIHYVDEGKGQVILFSHAAIGSSFMYRRFIQILSKSFRCVALDYPGFGLTPTSPKYKLSIVSQAKILDQFIMAIGLQNVIGLGHDTGGPSLFHIASQRPELFKGLILTDTIIFPTIEYRRIHRMLRLVGSWPFRWLNKQTNFLLKFTLNLGIRTRKLSKEEKKVYYAMTTASLDRNSMTELLFSLRQNPDFMEEVKSGFENQLNHKPTLLIYGEHDPVKQLGIPDRIHSMLPNSDFYQIKGESHFPHEGQPERMSEIIFQWVKKLKAI